MRPFPQRHPKAAEDVKAEPVEKKETRKPVLRDRRSPRRSRSPIKRSVKFKAPLEKEIPGTGLAGADSGLMRMAQAREAMPRLENESRANWKKRVFDFKREEEAKHGRREGPSQGPQK